MNKPALMLRNSSEFKMTMNFTLYVCILIIDNIYQIDTLTDFYNGALVLPSIKMYLEPRINI